MFRKIALVSIILVLIVIVLGAYVRLSDAGLGCPDWPGCYGSAVVSNAPEYIAGANATYPDNPLDVAKAWKEMGHRYAVLVLGVLIVILALMAWQVERFRRTIIWASLGLIALVIFQSALGMWTVTLKVMPFIVTSHLMMGLMIFWLLYRLYIQTSPNLTLRKQIKGPHRFAQFCMLILFIQIFLGGWTSTNFASLSCSGFPQCSGTWWPHADYRGALNILGSFLAGDTNPLEFPAQVAAHWIHRVGALVTFIFLSILSILATSSKNDKLVRRSGTYLSGLLLLQIILGIINVLMALPVWAAVAHTAVAALLMLALIRISFYTKYTVTSDLLERNRTKIVTTLDEQDVNKKAYVEPTAEALHLRLKLQLQRTSSGLRGLLSTLALNNKIDDSLLEEIETNLIMADVGVIATSKIMKQLEATIKNKTIDDGVSLLDSLQIQLQGILEPCNQPLEINKQGLFVILVVGVNGAGKTTTIGKLAKRLQAQGKSVMLAAGDTFRAAAVEQLQVWGKRNNIHVVAQHTGADSAAVIFDSIKSAQAKDIDVLIADTAGRLHTKNHLMDELIKIKRVIAKADATAPHEVLLVLDAGTGQNALAQAKLFNEAVDISGLALTKLDGTAKGGIIFSLAQQLQLPIRFVGVGEGISDLQEFNAQKYIEALFINDN